MRQGFQSTNLNGRPGSYQQPQPKKKFEPPRPVQLGSLKSENEGQDPGIRLVPSGGIGWGRRKQEGDGEDGNKDSPDLKPKEAPAKPKLGNLSAGLRPSWGAVAARSPAWTTLTGAQVPTTRQETASRRQEEEFPTLGAEASGTK
ncbi:unnamed protein product, partial [Polarella glacialis]